MNRRRFLATTGCAVLPFVSGCLNTPGSDGGLLEVLEATDLPETEITDASDGQIRDIVPVQEGLQQAHEGNRVAEIEVPEREYDEVAQALSALPFYDRAEHNTGYMSGIYIEYEETVYVVVLTPFCSDSWFRDAQSERGEYGWGGCYDREEWGY